MGKTNRRGGLGLTILSPQQRGSNARGRMRRWRVRGFSHDLLKHFLYFLFGLGRYRRSRERIRIF